MAITAASTFEEILADDKVVFTDADVADWNSITAVPTTYEALFTSNTDMVLEAKIGLFTFDLTDAKAAC